MSNNNSNNQTKRIDPYDYVPARRLIVRNGESHWRVYCPCVGCKKKTEPAGESTFWRHWKKLDNRRKITDFDIDKLHFKIKDKDRYPSVKSKAAYGPALAILVESDRSTHEVAERVSPTGSRNNVNSNKVQSPSLLLDNSPVLLEQKRSMERPSHLNPQSYHNIRPQLSSHAHSRPPPNNSHNLTLHQHIQPLNEEIETQPLNATFKPHLHHQDIVDASQLVYHPHIEQIPGHFDLPPNQYEGIQYIPQTGSSSRASMNSPLLSPATDSSKTNSPIFAYDSGKLVSDINRSYPSSQPGNNSHYQQFQSTPLQHYRPEQFQSQQLQQRPPQHGHHQAHPLHQQQSHQHHRHHLPDSGSNMAFPPWTISPESEVPVNNSNNALFDEGNNNNIGHVSGIVGTEFVYQGSTPSPSANNHNNGDNLGNMRSQPQ